MLELEELSRDELIERAWCQDRQISSMAAQVSELLEVNGRLAAQLVRLEHLLSRNSANSSMPPSKDDDPGKTPPPDKSRRGTGPKRKRGKQPGAAGGEPGVERQSDQASGSVPTRVVRVRS